MTFVGWLHGYNEFEMYSTYIEGKSVVAETFIRILKASIYKHMTAVSKNMYFNKLDEIADQYNKIYHRTIKMKPADVKVDTYIDYGVDHNKKDPKFKVGNHVNI